jgi:hypothetical protein
MVHHERCILGQLFGDFYDAEEAKVFKKKYDIRGGTLDTIFSMNVSKSAWIDEIASRKQMTVGLTFEQALAQYRLGKQIKRKLWMGLYGDNSFINLNLNDINAKDWIIVAEKVPAYLVPVGKKFRNKLGIFERVNSVNATNKPSLCAAKVVQYGTYSTDYIACVDADEVVEVLD